VVSWVQTVARRRPERAAVVGPERTLGYGELLALASAGAAALERRGARPGDRVALALAPGEGFVVAFHACLEAGMTAVPVDLRLSEDERRARLAGASLVLSEPLPAAGRSPARGPGSVAPEAPVAVMHTSGTTAAPKPVVLTYGNFEASALGSAVALGVDREERWLCPMPLSHVGGLMVLLRSAISACGFLPMMKLIAAPIA